MANVSEVWFELPKRMVAKSVALLFPAAVAESEKPVSAPNPAQLISLADDVPKKLNLGPPVDPRDTDVQFTIVPTVPVADIPEVAAPK